MSLVDDGLVHNDLRLSARAADSGAVLAEYALLAVLIAIAAVGAVALLGDAVFGLFRRVLDSLPF